MEKSSLGDRMKRYETTFQSYLSIRTPVIIRIDGKSFHTLTRKMEKPFDNKLIECMQYTACNLTNKIDGCNLAYTQSDEISLLLVDYKNINTDRWFDYNVQKLTSVSASMATYYFAKRYREVFKEDVPIAFDSRVFNLPKEEVANYFIWRQQDATRNSIQMLARANFSHKQLHKKSCNQLQDMLMVEKNINWNNLETYKKRGTCIFRKGSVYTIDINIPIFTKHREYIEDYVYLERENEEINER